MVLHLLQIIGEVPQQTGLFRDGRAQLIFRDTDKSGREQASYFFRHGCGALNRSHKSQGLCRMVCAGRLRLREGER